MKLNNGLLPNYRKPHVICRLEILNYSYIEHFKAEKDISLILPIDHPKRKLLQKHREEIFAEIELLRNGI